MSNKPYGRPAAELQEAVRQAVDQSILTTTCNFCPDFTHTGPAKQGRELAQAHRLEAHPDVRPVRRRRGHLQRWQATDDGYQAEGLARAAETAAMLARREAVA